MTSLSSLDLLLVVARVNSPGNPRLGAPATPCRRQWHRHRERIKRQDLQSRNGLPWQFLQTLRFLLSCKYGGVLRDLEFQSKDSSRSVPLEKKVDWSGSLVGGHDWLSPGTNDIGLNESNPPSGPLRRPPRLPLHSLV